jgi:hypothetical protein
MLRPREALRPEQPRRSTYHGQNQPTFTPTPQQTDHDDMMHTYVISKGNLQEDNSIRPG